MVLLYISIFNSTMYLCQNKIKYTMCNIVIVKYTLFMLLLAGMDMFKGNIFADTFKESYCIFR